MGKKETQTTENKQSLKEWREVFESVITLTTGKGGNFEVRDSCRISAGLVPDYCRIGAQLMRD